MVDHEVLEIDKGEDEEVTVNIKHFNYFYIELGIDWKYPYYEENSGSVILDYDELKELHTKIAKILDRYGDLE